MATFVKDDAVQYVTSVLNGRGKANLSHIQTVLALLSDASPPQEKQLLQWVLEKDSQSIGDSILKMVEKERRSDAAAQSALAWADNVLDVVEFGKIFRPQTTT